MPTCFEPRTDVLPLAQRQLWPALAAAPRLSFVLYGGTAVALYLGHRVSVDFDFFRSEALDKRQVRNAFPFLAQARTLQDEIDTLAASVDTPVGSVKVSYFGGVGLGRVNEPLQTIDGTLLVASPLDLLATKLKAILDRAQARDYQDIAALLRHRMSLADGLSAFRALFRGEPAAVLRAVGYFQDVPTLGRADREILIAARDQVGDIPEMKVTTGNLAVPTGACGDIVRPFDRHG